LLLLTSLLLAGMLGVIGALLWTSIVV
jgi:hypothetical protein